ELNLIAVVDIIEERAKIAAEKFGAKYFFTDYRKILDRDDIDIVDICTPTYTHREISVEAIKSGKNVLCEKPIALKLRDADEMIRAAEKNDVKFMVAHCLRFWPEYVRAKKLLEEGVIGEPRIARAYRYSSFPEWAPWHKRIDMGGGVFVDMSIHDVDFLRWSIGEVEKVYARGGTYLYEDATSHDYTHAILYFKNKAIGFVEGSWIMPKGFRFTTYLEIAGEKGLLTVDNRFPSSLYIYKHGGRETSSIVFNDDAYYLEVKEFVKTVIEDREPPIKGDDAKKTLEVVLATVKSVIENKPVSLPLTTEVIV
ncbi:MAG TPA: Gfo/Idh/MocA family oxidoreductase, partial [Thermoprotei archaeon]|nr:Gfo/Idh/MocA family oxidoreductase [Thermoprotei archaeon]